jgi:DNA-binding CsgD family transcriptional regulator
MKHASAHPSLEPTVSAAHLAAAITTAASMGVREKERVCDRIYAEQPNLLSSVLAQRSLGVSMPAIDVLLNILIVLYLTIEQSGQVLAIVSEADQERELQRLTAAVRFTEGLAGDALAQSIEQTTAYRREKKFLFAYVVDALLGARGYLLKSDTDQALIEAIKALASHKTFFTPKVSEALLHSFTVRSRHEGSALTARERQVVQLIAEGHTNKSTAKMLGVSLNTVETFREKVRQKLHLSSPVALARYAIRNKLIEL